MSTQIDYVSRERSRLLLKLKWFFLFSCGITEDSIQRMYVNLYSCVLAAFVTVDVLAFYIGYKGSDMSFTEQIDSLYSAAGRIYLYLMYWCVKLNRESCLRLFSILRKIHRNMTGVEAIAQGEEHFIKIAKTVFFILSSLLVVSTIVPMCQNVLTKPINFDVSLFDYWLTCKHDNEFFLAVFCWNVDAYWNYTLKNVIQLLTMIVELLPLFTIVLFHIFMYIYIEACIIVISNQFEATNLIWRKYKVVRKKRGETEERGTNALYRNQMYNQSIEQCIIDLIKYQTHVYRIIDNLKPILTSITNISVCAGAIMMLLSVCILRMQTESYSYSQLRSASGLLVIVFPLYLQCMIGQQIADLNCSLSNIVYSAPWYQFSTGIKTMVLRVMLLQQKPLEIKALRAHVVNKGYGLWVLKMVYNTASLITATIKT